MEKFVMRSLMYKILVYLMRDCLGLHTLLQVDLEPAEPDLEAIEPQAQQSEQTSEF